MYTKKIYWCKKKLQHMKKGPRSRMSTLQKNCKRKNALAKLVHFNPIHYNSKFPIMIKAQKNIDEGRTIKINFHMKFM